jgi:xylose isomerase
MWTVGYENGLHMDKFVMGQEQVFDFFQMVLERKSQITKSGAMTIVPTCR